jgi:hypothetical protein
MLNLWSQNTPDKFWLCDQTIPEETWSQAIQKSLELLDLGCVAKDSDELMALTLGEAQFGPEHWKLSFPKRSYYLIKPLLPRSLIRILRRHYDNPVSKKVNTNWPIDSRYARFQWDVISQILASTAQNSIKYKSFWPEAQSFAFVLTHDIETAIGQAFVREVADLEEGLGLRSCFNFVLERYELDFKLIQELRERGFEVGCHGLKHDGKLYSSEKEFSRRAARINTRMKEYGMSGFRSPLTHRNPEWMQALEIEYDSSFFDTDPFEPIPGGAMSIWPYFLGRFVELPYTLVQDYTLTSILGETTPRIWLEKVKFIREYHGMALLNSHPDYLKDPTAFRVYAEFLEAMKKAGGYWHALPHEAARWWKFRAGSGSAPEVFNVSWGIASLEAEKTTI